MPGTSPDFWLDIYDASEGKVGAGPITTCVSWSDTNALNRIGSFRCTIPAGESKLALIPMRGYLKCYSIRGDMTDLVSVGLIRKRRTFTRGNASFVEFSGPSYGDELNFRLVHDLELSSIVSYCPAEAQWHIPDADLPVNEQPWNVDLTVTGDYYGQPNPLQMSLCDGIFNGRWYFNRPWPNGQNSGFPNTGYFYFGNEEPFYQVHIHMTRDYTDPLNPYGSKNERPATWELQYFNGGDMGWDTVPAGEWEDGTVGGNENTFGHSGIISWTEDGVENWTRTNHIDRNLYWIRMKPNVHLDDFDLSEVEILVHTETEDDLQPILDYAPPGWDLVGTGSTTGSYIQFSGETVLAALNKIAEQSGDHFRISNRGRFVTWIKQTAAADSAGVLLLRADGGAQTSSVTAFISSIEKLEASEDIVTRIYPYGSGNAGARLVLKEFEEQFIIIPPLEERMNAGPEGNTDQYEVNYDADPPYIENLTATARWGLIEREVQFNEIDEIQDDIKGQIAASYQLLNTAFAWLQAHSEAQEDTYRVTVVGLEKYPYPGQTYRLLYQEERDGALSVNIQGSFVATEVTQTLTAGQAPTVSLVLTNNVLRRTMVTGQSRLARIEQAVRYQTKRQRTAHDNILDRVNERHSRPWHIIETAVEDPDGDISPLAKAIYRSIKDHGLAR